MKATLSRIAKEAGCSAVTVHKALTNQSGVSAELKNSIITIANRMGYNPPVDTGKNSNANFIYLVDKEYLLKPGEQFYTAIYFYLNEMCMKDNSKLSLLASNDPETTIAYFNTLAETKKVDGIFVGGQIDQEILRYIDGKKIKTVCIDFYSSDYAFDYVYVDNYYSGYLLAKYLIQKGHTKIGYVGNIKISNSIADRYFGYRRALNKYNIEFNKKYSHPFSQYHDIKVDLNDLPTAYICHCDKTAEYMYQYFDAKNIKINDQVSIISFDNTDICETLRPKLTSFGISKEEYSKTAYKLMLQKIKSIDQSSNYIKIDLKLFERDSVKVL